MCLRRIPNDQDVSRTLDRRMDIDPNVLADKRTDGRAASVAGNEQSSIYQ